MKNEEFDRGMIVMFSKFVWKYGDIQLDETTEKEYHVVELSYDEVMDFGYQALEVIHDNKNRKSYYRVSRKEENEK